MAELLTLRTDLAVSLVNETHHLTERPKAIPEVLAALAHRPAFACSTELVVTWALAVEHLRRQHHWLINATPPASIADWGMVGRWAWLDHLAQRYGPTVTTTLLDPSDAPWCVRHNRSLF